MALSLDERERAFRELYAAHFDTVLGFALRRVDRPEDAGDVTADTFLVAWRRLAHAPQGSSCGRGSTASPVGCSRTIVEARGAAPPWGTGCAAS